MKRQWKVILGFVLVLIIVVFAVLNNQEVPVNFGFSKLYSPLILVIIGSAIIGALVIFLTSSATMFQQKRQVKQLQSQIDEFETNNQEKLAEDKARYQREKENELAALKAEYERLLNEKDVYIQQLSGEEAPKSDPNNPPLDYYD
ncbi:lipopolysaccharide assembly protein LapA domain-containing protein [Enterococcus sp. AZ072]|uniref:LapA family protein n=1 Tax=unclassified Enterococcus TaxID=2608891 RepID=UPI003D2E204F